MDIYTGIETAFAIRTYWKALKDYFSPKIRKAKKRLDNRYFIYDMDMEGDLLFWKDILKDEFHNPTDKKIEESSKSIRIGDIVELRNSNISKWIPFFPGKKFSIEGKKIMDKHYHIFPKNHDFGLEEELISRNDSFVLSGTATIRILPFKDQFLLCASGLGCETGIPILISDRMYEDKIQDTISKEGSLNANIICTLSELPWEWKDRIDKSFMNKINPDIYGLPRIVLKVNELKKIGTSPKIFAQAWTQFINLDYKHTSLTNSFFTPNDPEDIRKAVNMVANYKNFLESNLIGGKWDIDIEFDETRNWFKSRKYKSFNASGVELFGVYYLNPWGRILLDKNRTSKK